MKLYEELYFDITVSGSKGCLERFEQFLRAGALDDYFDMSDDYIIHADGYASAEAGEHTFFTFTNDEIGISIDELDPEEFLEALCRQSRSVELRGNLFDIEEGEFVFVSAEGDTDFSNARNTRFNDELDEQALEEEYTEDDDY